MSKGIVKIGLSTDWVGLSLGSNRHSTRSSRVNKFLSCCRNRLSQFFGLVGQIRRVIGLKEKNTKRGKIQAKKKLGMEKEREITIAKIKYRAWNGDKERNEILKSHLRERRPNT